MPEPNLAVRVHRKLVAIGVSVVTAVVTVAAMITPAQAGLGAPSGPHYNLDIIGVETAKSAPMDNSNRHTIFVPLHGECRINLSEGSFNVADGNCFDGDGAAFTLPDPDPDGDGVTAYSVYARALGKPGGSAQAVTCFEEDGETFCSTHQLLLVRSTGPPVFANVSEQLLSLCLDTDGDDVCDTREFLFDREMADYFWTYTNDGLKLAQLRFYEIPTTVGTTP